jgi:hypothetical protein
MKISCPSCGSVHTIPQDVIDRILAKNRSKPQSPQEQFFEEIASEADFADPVLDHKGIFEIKHRRTDAVALAVLVMGILLVIAVFAAGVWHNIAYPHESLGSAVAMQRVAVATLAAIVSLAIYLAPTAIAFFRGHPNAGAIAAVNVLLGWTFLGYALALVWALTAIADSVRATVLSRFRQ